MAVAVLSQLATRVPCVLLLCPRGHHSAMETLPEQATRRPEKPQGFACIYIYMCYIYLEHMLLLVMNTPRCVHSN